ncbi:MAG: hypothetical protein EXS03_08900 [Phycisphaerales bacterium]|nr:hypothetical protein [Phycisphaerales bacterium]
MTITLLVAIAASLDTMVVAECPLPCDRPRAQWTFDELPQVQAYDEARAYLAEAITWAFDGSLSQRELRVRRRAFEVSLDETLESIPAATAPGDLAFVEEARSQFNQARIISMEWEHFGAVADPAWGWDPLRARGDAASLYSRSSCAPVAQLARAHR